MKLRPYQEECVENIKYCVSNNINALAVLPCGAGKSVVIAELINQLKLERNTVKCLMVVDSATLVEQNADKLKKINDKLGVGIFCSTLGQKKLTEEITYATIQSIHKVDVNELGWYDTIIIDECHMISNKGEGIYFELINKLKELNPNLIVVGLSATPFRTQTGMITEGEHRIFEDICFEITIDELLEQGYLSPIISKITRQDLDLSKIKIKNKEYDIEELDLLMSNEQRVEATIGEVLTIASDRKHFLWFCSGLNHVAIVEEKLQNIGRNARAITGKTPKNLRDKYIEEYKEGIITDLISCDVFTKGFDAPCTDCLVCLRPTKSTGLYIQIVGRLMRLYPDKINGLFLDFANVIAEHGAINDIKIKKKYNPQTHKSELQAVKMIDNTKLCLQCRTLLKKSELVCPSCGFEYTTEQVLRHDIKPSELDIMATKNPNQYFDVEKTEYVDWTAKSGNKCLKIVYYCTNKEIVNEFKVYGNFYFDKFLDVVIERENQDFKEYLAEVWAGSFSNFKRNFNQENHKQIMEDTIEYFRNPIQIQVIKEGKYYKVQGVVYGDKKVEEHIINEKDYSSINDENFVDKKYEEFDFNKKAEIPEGEIF